MLHGLIQYYLKLEFKFMRHELLQHDAKLNEKVKSCNPNDQFKTNIKVKNGLENYCFMMCNIEMYNFYKVLVPYCDLHVFYMNKEDLQTSHGLIQYNVKLEFKLMLHELLQYYAKLNKKANNCNPNNQIETKIKEKNGLESYCFMMCKIEMANLCMALVLYSDLHVFSVNDRDLQILRGLIQYYMKLDEKVKNRNFGDQLKTKIEMKNGLEKYINRYQQFKEFIE